MDFLGVVLRRKRGPEFILVALNVRSWPIFACRHRPLWVDSVEKVGFPKMLEYWWAKTPLLHAAT
jgi:hypothetical protein